MATNKAVLTFGIRGGRLSGQHVLGIKEAAKMARDLSHVFGRDNSKEADFIVSRATTMQSWQSSTNYVSVQLLTGTGDESAKLWRLPE
jgi:hypothetical protein